MRFYKKAFKKITSLLLYVTARITPKKNVVVLRGFPAFEDNILAIYSAVCSRKFEQIIWVVDNISLIPPVSINRNTKFVKRGGIADIYYSVTSRFIFITHGHFLRRTPSNQVCVNLWHGIPFKRIGMMQGSDGRSDTFLVATSDFTREILAHSFGLPEEKIVITGQPRTDRMLSADRDSVLRRAFPNRSLPKFVLFWLPTFRRSTYLENQCDGSLFDNIFNCSDFSVTEFNSILKERDAICFVKPHPMATKQNLADESNILFIDENWLSERKLSLYELIGATDCLVSDISSVIADFMLLDRPIILLFEDIVAYEKSRGFSFNPITHFLPAEVARDFNAFLVELEAVLDGEDLYAEKREKLKRRFFHHTDAGASNRILDIAMGERSLEQ